MATKRFVVRAAYDGGFPWIVSWHNSQAAAERAAKARQKRYNANPTLVKALGVREWSVRPCRFEAIQFWP